MKIKLMRFTAAFFLLPFFSVYGATMDLVWIEKASVAIGSIPISVCVQRSIDKFQGIEVDRDNSIDANISLKLDAAIFGSGVVGNVQKRNDLTAEIIFSGKKWSGSKKQHDLIVGVLNKLAVEIENNCRS